MERGTSTFSMELWQRAFVALGRRLLTEPSRDELADPADAGHLPMKELILRLARASGIAATFELRVPGSRGRHSIDNFLRDDRHRRLVVVE